MKNPEKIYFSKLSYPEIWHEGRVYWFPYAENIMHTKYGWKILSTYIAIRMWFDGKTH